MTYVFEKEGNFELPQVEIRWWDTSEGRLRTETLAAVEIDVGPYPDLAVDCESLGDEVGNFEYRLYSAAGSSGTPWSGRELAREVASVREELSAQRAYRTTDALPQELNPRGAYEPT